MVLKRKTDHVEGEKGWVDGLIPEDKIRSSNFMHLLQLYVET